MGQEVPINCRHYVCWQVVKLHQGLPLSFRQATRVDFSSGRAAAKTRFSTSIQFNHTGGMSMKLPTLAKLLEDQLKDLYNAENQLVKALPRMAKKASAQGLKDAITSHLDETKTHVQRLDRIGASLGIKLSGKRCKAMEGLIEEGAEALAAEGPHPVIDSAIIAAAQRVEHYEISAYGTARTFAAQLGHNDAADLLQETLGEESAADEKLTSISEGEILPIATSAEQLTSK
jgi:ferritin-like metal-binding protein YciE